jgi:hypothetical protein
MLRHQTSLVMPGLVPGIHVFQTFNKQGVDGRDKPGHDVTTQPAFISPR